MMTLSKSTFLSCKKVTKVFSKHIIFVFLCLADFYVLSFSYILEIISFYFFSSCLIHDRRYNYCFLKSWANISCQNTFSIKVCKKVQLLVFKKGAFWNYRILLWNIAFGMSDFYDKVCNMQYACFWRFCYIWL
jgi:hypothetical protein